MRRKIQYLNSQVLKRVSLLAFFSVFTTLIYGQCPDPPAFETEQYFCSVAAWALIGEDGDTLGDLRIYTEDPAWTLTWYEDAALTTPVIDPDNEILVDGTTYYVTQTDGSACESDPLEVTVSERDCGCVKDGDFQDQNGNPRGSGYEFFQFSGISNHKTCGQIMAGANPLPMGTIDGMGVGDDAVFVTAGNDPPHTPTGTVIPLTRTNPGNPYSTHGIRINRSVEYGTVITSMQKEFIAGEVFVFDFSLIVQNPPTGHAPHQMPFGQVRLYDQNGDLVQQRCLISDTNDCIFNGPFNPGSQQVLFSDWSCMKLNTLEYQGQPLTAEFVVAYCTPTQHFAYIYIDKIYAGDDSEGICGNSSFGYALIDSILPAGDSCFIPEPPAELEGCVSGLSANIPGFPLEVCGVYDAPISSGPPPVLDDIRLNIIQNDNVVGTLTSPSAGDGPNTFCFTVEQSDINVLPYGSFTFDIEVDFALDCGSPYNFFIDDRSSFNLCPTAGCPNALTFCDVTGTGIADFDLTQANNDIYGNWTAADVDLSFYENENDAHEGVNEIADPANYQNTIPGGQTIYVRLDWDDSLVDGCYYLVALDLMVNPIPQVDWEDEIVVCESNFEVILIATPDNLPELGTISYIWYRDNVQIPTSGSFYTATQPGEYTVIVSNFLCEVTQTVTITQVGFEIDLGNDVDVCEEGASYVLTPQINQDPGTNINPGDFVYLWSTGETTPSITVTDSDLYWVEVSYEDCTEIDQVMVTVVERPVVSVGPDMEVCKGETITLEAVVTNMDATLLEFRWYDDGGVLVGSGSTIEITEQLFGGENFYTVEVYDPATDFCTGEDTLRVKYYDNENCVISQGLSPNGTPGFNDNLDLAFLADRTGIERLQIFNRYGNLVYERQNYVDEWVGQTDDGDELPTGTYFYLITFSGDDPVYGTQANGWIYINRGIN